MHWQIISVTHTVMRVCIYKHVRCSKAMNCQPRYTSADRRQIKKVIAKTGSEDCFSGPGQEVDVFFKMQFFICVKLHRVHLKLHHRRSVRPRERGVFEISHLQQKTVCKRWT